MTDSSGGWEPLRKPSRAGTQPPPPRREPTGIGNGLLITPFTRLARVQAFSSMADGMIAVALAGSIFFSIDPDAARWRVALYLVLTIAPFAVVTPLLGPAIDRARGGRRGMIILSLALRAVIAFLMVRHIDSLFLFPEAFVMLILQKAYFVSRTALVPAVCPHHDELIEANSKLTLISAFSGVFGGTLATILVWAFDSNSPAAALAVVAFLIGSVFATQVPHVQIAANKPDETEKHEVRGAGILLAAGAVGIMRGIVGFTTFMLAFSLRAGEDGVDRSEPGAGVGAALGTIRDIDVDGTPGPPTWHLGLVGLSVGLGAFLGARYAPRIRETTTEERIVFGALAGMGAAALLAAWGGGISGTALLAFAVAICAATAKLGFDALVQRDAPHANHGRIFARFEGRFQLMWSAGAFIPVLLRIPIRLGALLIAIAAIFAATSYEIGRRTDRVKSSSAVAQAIRERVPVDRLNLGGAGARLGSVRSRFTPGGRQPPPPSTPLDPTVVAPLPEHAGADEQSVALDDVEWTTPDQPHLTSGEGVWLAPPDPGDDPTLEHRREPDEEGQYKLWSDESDAD